MRSRARACNYMIYVVGSLRRSDLKMKYWLKVVKTD